jgi:hypothetical protein
MADFDCTDAKADLEWNPIADQAKFIALAIDLHA